jgi:hypothetical protein
MAGHVKFVVGSTQQRGHAEPSRCSRCERRVWVASRAEARELGEVPIVICLQCAAELAVETADAEQEPDVEVG